MAQKTAPKKGKQRRPHRKEQWKAAFLKRLSETGNVTEAAEYVSVERSNVYKERYRDPTFAVAWDEAKRLGVESLEDEAIKRAIEGKSDTLLIFLLKAAKPEKYRENYRVQIEPPSAPVPQEEGGFVNAMLARMESKN